jgi:hypothetical protein
MDTLATNSNPEATEANILERNPFISVTFDQLSILISNITKDFSSTIKDLVSKFETINSTKIDTLEGHIFSLSDRIEKLEDKLQKVLKSNQLLKNQLCDNYINNIKDKEAIFSQKFEINGFTKEVALQDNKILSGQELMDKFTANTLKLKTNIKLDDSKVEVTTNSSTGDSLYKLKGTMADNRQWANIFSNIIALKETNLYFDRYHCPEVQEVLKEFRKRMSTARLQMKKASLKNLTLTIEDVSYEVYSILRSRFLKENY